MPQATVLSEEEAAVAKRRTIAVYQCPACFLLTTDNQIEASNSRSDRDDSYVCSQCGTDEPLLNFIRDWPPVTNEEHTILEVILMTAEDRISAGRKA